MTIKELIAEIEAQIDLMIAVSTNGPRIDAVDGEYMERRRRVAVALESLNLTDPNPFESLWRWYGRWSSELPRWHERRTFVRDLYADTLRALESLSREDGVAVVFEEPTGWAKVDRILAKARVDLMRAQAEEEFQAIGLMCREALISLGQEVFDPRIHVVEDGISTSSTDAKRMLVAYIAHTLAGGSAEVLRRHARAALNLANEVQHRNTTTFREAAICLEATISVVNVVAILEGRRDSLSIRSTQDDLVQD